MTNLERALGSHGPVGWSLPEQVFLTADGRRLEWTLGGKGRSKDPRRARAGAVESGPLGAFLRLAHPEAGAREVLAFAQRWGVFGPVALPWWRARERVGVVTHPAPRSRPWERSRGYDRVSAWKRCARELAGLAVAAGELRARQAVSTDPLVRGLAEQLEGCQDREAELALRMAGASAGRVRAVLKRRRSRRPAMAEAASEVVVLLGVQALASLVELRWSAEIANGVVVPKLRLGGGSLLGWLAAELVLSVSRSDGVVACSGCRTPFLPKRVQAGRRAFCARCGVRVRNLLASRAYRARKASREAHKATP